MWRRTGNGIVTETTHNDSRPLLTAIAVSVLFHALLAWLNPSLWAHLTEPEIDTVVVELLREKEGEPKPTPASDTRRAARNEARPAEVSQKAPTPAEAPAPSSAGLKGEAQPDPLKFQADAKPLEEDEAISVTSELPDPTSETVAEATMSLDNPDKRYRGFLEKIRAAINRSWNAREAMLKARRSGNTTVQFTLSSGGGQADSPILIAQSGSAALDDEALKAVRRASFPAFPNNWAIRRLNLIGDFEYAIAGM